MNSFLKFLLFLVVSSGLACLLAGFFWTAGKQIETCITGNHYYGSTCDIDSLSGIVFDFLPASYVTGIYFLIFGHLIAFPSLLTYLVVSWALWKADIKSIWSYLFTGTSAATANGVVFLVILAENWDMLFIFAMTGFFTSLFHIFLVKKFKDLQLI